MPEPPAPTPRRFLTWRKIGGTLLVGVVLWGVATWVVGHLAESRWAAMKSRWQGLLEEARGRRRSRDPLRGAAVEGNAWEHYSAAIRETRTLYDLESQAAPNFLESGSGADRALVEKVLVRHPVLIDAVRRGASRKDANLGLEWKEGALEIPSRHGSATIARLAVCQARFLADRGQTREALELLLDTCRFVGDLDHVEDLEPELRELHALIQAGRLSRPDLEELVRELEILDREFPRRGHRVALEFVALGSLFIRSGGSITPQLVGLGVDPEDGLWRYFFSGRLMKADAFDRIADAARQLDEADDRPWPESRDRHRMLAAELGSCPNPIARTAPEEVLRSDAAHRGHRAQLRLIRLAAQYRLTGDLPELDDPFGDKLRHRKGEDAVRIWSVGPEGRDHGGAGTFSFDPDGREEKDILLEIRR